MCAFDGAGGGPVFTGVAVGLAWPRGWSEPGAAYSHFYLRFCHATATRTAITGMANRSTIVSMMPGVCIGCSYATLLGLRSEALVARKDITERRAR
jgi:hypothetical protein